MKIWHLPIEPYQTRYTADWIQQFENEFVDNQVEFETILGQQVTSTLKAGTVLDCCGTNIYKFSQLITLLSKINNNEVKDGDCVFICDMWFPGLESLFYVRNLTKIDFKIYGILHAGTWDEYDFTAQAGMGKWAKEIESSWIKNVNKVFVATEFHKQLISSYISDCEDNIYVTGIPFYADALRAKYNSVQKENIVVFPHRCMPEKQPELFDKLSRCPELSNFRFVKTLDECKTRNEYFELLARAKYMVSFANQETFGYSTVESMALQCKVIVPNQLSYKETVPSNDRFDITSDWVECVKNKILDYERSYQLPNYSIHLQQWTNAIKNMILFMKGNN